jgi:CHAT domain-containing protein
MARDGIRLNFAGRRTAEWRAASAPRPSERPVEALLEQGRVDDASMIAQRAAALGDELCLPPDSIHLAAVRAVQARIVGEQGDWQRVAAIFEAIRVGLSGDPAVFDRLYAGNPDYALADIALRRAESALARIQVALERARAVYGEDAPETAVHYGLKAVARAAMGDIELALEDARRYHEILRKASRSDRVLGERRRRQITDALIDALIESARRQSRDVAALSEPLFEIASLSAGGRVQAAISAAASRTAIPDPALAALVREEQDASNTTTVLAEVLANLSAAGPDQVLPQRITEVRGALQQARERGVQLRARITATFPDYNELTAPSPPALREVARLLAPGQAYLQSHTTERHTIMWAISAENRQAASVARLGRRDLRTLVDALREPLDLGGQGEQALRPYDIEAAYHLYRELLAPIEAAWQPAAHLIVAADGDLARIPLGILPTRPAPAGGDRDLAFDRYRGVAWLAASYALSQVPAATALRTRLQAPADSADRLAFLGFGDPSFGGKDAVVGTRGATFRTRPRTRTMASARLADLPRLPDTADEIQAIARTLGGEPGRDIYLGNRATDATVLGLDRSHTLARYQVVSFATHGLVPGDLDGLAEPALAMAAGGDSDGLLTLTKVLSLRLAADWVVLSACNTAAGDTAAGEAISGLGRAFLYAGSRSVLVSHWAVFSPSTTALMIDMFERYATEPASSRAAVLKAAMAKLRDQGEINLDGRRISYAHPIFWAPFSLVGDGGGARAATASAD